MQNTWSKRIAIAALLVGAAALVGIAVERAAAPAAPTDSLATITSISPPSGPSSGNTQITIKGTNFLGGSTVSFGGISAQSVKYISATTLTALTPRHAAGIVDVTATSDHKVATLRKAYTYTGIPGRYSIVNQQPVTSQYYEGSLFTTPLPADVGSHLVSNSAAIISNVYSSGVTTAYTVLTNVGSQSTAAAQMAFYYSDEADPIYKVTYCGHVATDPLYNPVGKYFHITNEAKTSSYNSDSFLLVWDQSSDIDHTPGGRIVAFYHGHDLSPCSCTTAACANATSACQIVIEPPEGSGNGYCDLGFPGKQRIIYGTDTSSGGYASLHAAPAAGFLRDEEIMSETVNHALLLNTACTTNPIVFPATGYGVMVCSRTGDDGNHPHTGNLIYVDSGYDCTTVPHWQRGVCKAMQTYGGYITDTGGNHNGGGFSIIRTEGGMAYATAGMTWPFLDYIAKQSGNAVVVRGSPAKGANLPFLNLPGVQNHIHVVDPCIARRMAGVSGSC